MMISRMTICLITLLLPIAFSFEMPAHAQSTLPPPSPHTTVNAPQNDAVSRAAAANAATRLRIALDALAGGNALAARALAQDGLREFGQHPELSFLLAYLLQGEGRNAEALAVLEDVAPVSALAREYSAQLRSQAIPNVPADTGTQRTQSTLAPPATPAVTPSASGGLRLAQTDARLAALEDAMANLVNAERRKAGLRPLVTDSQLADIARAHSAEMRDRSYFAHESPTAALREPLDRYRAVTRATPRMIAENIYRIYSYGSSSNTARRAVTEQDVRDGHEALMKSPGHRANIMEPRVTRVGIGIVASATGDLWITQIFLLP